MHTRPRRTSRMPSQIPTSYACAFFLLSMVAIHSPVTGDSCPTGWDAPDCDCFVETGFWDLPPAPLLVVARQTVGTVESCIKDGGQPFYQIQKGFPSRAEAQSSAAKYSQPLMLGPRRPWCSETVAWWHREAQIPYPGGYATWWYPSWQIRATDGMRSWYKAAEVWGGGRWIGASELDLENFLPGINAPCPGAYQQIMGYKPGLVGSSEWLPFSPWEGSSNAHSQVVERMVLYYLDDELTGDVVDFDLKMIEGNASNAVIDTTVYTGAFRYTPDGGAGPGDYLGSKKDRKIRGWGIDLDVHGNPICNGGIIEKKKWPAVGAAPSYDHTPHVTVDKEDQYQVSRYRLFGQAMKESGIRASINQSRPSYTSLPTEREPWRIGFVDGKADISIDFPLALPYLVDSIEIHFGGTHPPDMISARMVSARGEGRRCQCPEEVGHPYEVSLYLDEGLNMALLPFREPALAGEFYLELVSNTKTSRPSEMAISAIYFHPYVDPRWEDSDDNP